MFCARAERLPGFIGLTLMVFYPKDFGVPLPGVYAVWIIVVLPDSALARDLPPVSPAKAGLSEAGLARLDAAMERHVRD